MEKEAGLHCNEIRKKRLERKRLACNLGLSLQRSNRGRLRSSPVTFSGDELLVISDYSSSFGCAGRDVFPPLKDFSWQRGYGAFTVSQSQVELVHRYIAGQKEHHQKISFRDEFIEFLKVNGIEYDERFI